jgi:hypothetical protein
MLHCFCVFSPIESCYLATFMISSTCSRSPCVHGPSPTPTPRRRAPIHPRRVKVEGMDAGGFKAMVQLTRRQSSTGMMTTYVMVMVQRPLAGADRRQVRAGQAEAHLLVCKLSGEFADSSDRRLLVSWMVSSRRRR